MNICFEIRIYSIVFNIVHQRNLRFSSYLMLYLFILLLLQSNEMYNKKKKKKKCSLLHIHLFMIKINVIINVLVRLDFFLSTNEYAYMYIYRCGPHRQRRFDLLVIRRERKKVKLKGDIYSRITKMQITIDA